MARRGLRTWAQHAGALITFLMIGCSDQTVPVVPGPPAPPPLSAAPFVVAPAASVVTAEQDVYISLPPDSIPTGVSATISNRRTGASVTAAIVGGGFDPVVIAAMTGDSITITVQTTGSPLSFTVVVPPVIPPVVVRTDPPPHKRDVPLNASLVMVFSQPIGVAALTNGSISLSYGGGTVSGHLAFADSAHTSVLLVPNVQLAAQTDYQLAVSTAVKNLVGSPLVAPASIPFTTAAATTTAPGIASISVSPISATVTLGNTLQLFATIKDSSDNVVRNATVSWATGDPAVATVSNGLIQAVSAGTAVISARVGVVIGSATITVTPAGPSLTFASVTVGEMHSCALTTDGVAYCWGEAGAQLGNGSVANSSVPQPVITQLRFAQLAASTWETCGVTTDNALYCWGYGPDAALNEPAPTSILPGVSIKAISPGAYHDCALATTGAAYCWGYGYYGELGGDSAAFAATCPVSSSIPQPVCNMPTPVAGGLLFKSINADDGEGSCGITTSGAAYCWGDNLAGSLGVGSNVGPQGCVGDEWDVGPIFPVVYPCSTVPAAVTGGHLFSDVESECGLASDSQIYCWGEGGWGVLGVGTTTGPSWCSYVTPAGVSEKMACSPVPVPVAGGLSFIQVSGRSERECGLTTAGAAWCWGSWGKWADVGVYVYTSQSSTIPVLIGGGIAFTSISVSGDHACGVTAAGAIYCWGGNRWGELGDGTTTQRTTPVKVLQP